MRIVDDAAHVRASASATVGLVPTMGYLHEGHLSLLTAAREECDTVVMSLFLNPLQFDNPDDLDRYPLDSDRDMRLAEEAGVDIVFAPSLQAMYPTEPLTRVRVAEVGDHFEGEHRPGHFEGVATVVTKLLASLQPHRAYFGRKDHQQLVLVRRMVADLSLPVDVIGCPIIREPDGLALSSRNIFIRHRDAALTVNRGLEEAAAAVDSGERSSSALTAIVSRDLGLESVDYVGLASQSAAAPLDVLDRPAFLAVAGHLDGVRLIDNLPIDLVGEMLVPDLGIRLAGRSELGGE